MSNIQTQIKVDHRDTSSKSINTSSTVSADDAFFIGSYENTTSPIILTPTAISTPKGYFASNLSGDDLLVSLDGGVSYPISVIEGDAVYFSLDMAGNTGVVTLTMDTQPTDGNTITIGARTYTWEDTLTDVDGNIFTGADLAAAKLNLGYAIAASGGSAGTDYALSTTVNTEVTVGAFVGDDAVFTAIAVGVAGNLTSTETFTAVTNVFSSATLVGGAALPVVYGKSRGITQSQVMVVPN